MAIEKVRLVGLDRWLGGQLASSRVTHVPALRAMVQRGLDEIEALLTQYKVK
jgi:hypothetical protein